MLSSDIVTPVTTESEENQKLQNRQLLPVPWAVFVPAPASSPSTIRLLGCASMYSLLSRMLEEPMLVGLPAKISLPGPTETVSEKLKGGPGGGSPFGSFNVTVTCVSAAFE